MWCLRRRTESPQIGNSLLHAALVTDRNPQAREMADESMVRTLAAQAEAIWPQEEPLVRRYAPRDVLDVGCGTGEVSSRIAAMFPGARVTGVDLIESHLELARGATTTANLTFRAGRRVRAAVREPLVRPRRSAAHVLQAIPTPERALAEMVRVARPGGHLHVIAEDYEMIFAAPARLDISAFWHQAPRDVRRRDRHRPVHRPQHPPPAARAAGRRHRGPRTRTSTPTACRAPRSRGSSRPGATATRETLAPHLGWPVERVRDHFDATIECIRNPDGFALWLVPIVTCRVR